jgi:hypothetical protein
MSADVGEGGAAEGAVRGETTELSLSVGTVAGEVSADPTDESDGSSGMAARVAGEVDPDATEVDATEGGPVGAGELAALREATVEAACDDSGSAPASVGASGGAEASAGAYIDLAASATRTNARGPAAPWAGALWASKGERSAALT